MTDIGLWGQEWDVDATEPWFTGRSRDVARGRNLGATVYELPPGGGSLYHFHHGAEEMIAVLEGTLTLRTPTGTQELTKGDVVHFAAGPEGAHQTTNRSDTSVRFLMVSTLPSPEVVEYPDTRQISTMAFTNSQDGVPLWAMHALPAASNDPEPSR